MQSRDFSTETKISIKFEKSLPAENARLQWLSQFRKPVRYIQIAKNLLKEITYLMLFKFERKDGVVAVLLTLTWKI